MTADIPKMRARLELLKQLEAKKAALAHPNDRARWEDVASDCAQIEFAIIKETPDMLNELEQLREETRQLKVREARLSDRVSYYERALCLAQPRPLALPSGAVTGTIEPERVGDVLSEREALKAEVERLRTALRDEAQTVRRAGWLNIEQRLLAVLYPAAPASKEAPRG